MKPRHHSRSHRRPHRQTSDIESQRSVVGIHSVREVLRVRPRAASELWVREGAHPSEALDEILHLAKQCSVSTVSKPLGQLDKVSPSHQGVCIWVRETPVLDWQTLEKPGKMQLMILDGLEDPHNLGAVMRTAWLMGVPAIFIPQDRAASLTASAAKVASGGAEHVALEVFTSLTGPVEKLKSLGFWIYGLAEEGKGSLWQLNLPDKVAWVIGAEGRGLRAATRKLCDEVVHIFQVQAGASYNASVAAALALAEGARRK